MNNYDYVILFDENAQPYIEHKQRKIHKYIKKIGDGIAARYFYTKEQLAAFEAAKHAKRYSDAAQRSYKTAHAISEKKWEESNKHPFSYKKYKEASDASDRAVKAREEAIKAAKVAYAKQNWADEAYENSKMAKLDTIKTTAKIGLKKLSKILKKSVTSAAYGAAVLGYGTYAGVVTIASLPIGAIDQLDGYNDHSAWHFRRTLGVDF